jgi:hypothetical protein
MKSVLNGIEAIYNAPKDWSPHGGLFWFTILMVSLVVYSAFFNLSQKKGL